MDVLLVVGSKASYVHTVYTMHQSMNRERTTLLVVDGVGDVVSESVCLDKLQSYESVRAFAARKADAWTDSVLQRYWRAGWRCNAGHGATAIALQEHGRG